MSLTDLSSPNVAVPATYPGRRLGGGDNGSGGGCGACGVRVASATLVISCSEPQPITGSRRITSPFGGRNFSALRWRADLGLGESSLQKRDPRRDFSVTRQALSWYCACLRKVGVIAYWTSRESCHRLIVERTRHTWMRVHRMQAGERPPSPTSIRRRSPFALSFRQAPYHPPHQFHFPPVRLTDHAPLITQPFEAGRRWPIPATATLPPGPAPRSPGRCRHRHAQCSQAEGSP
jgi:hypothetical protein